MAKLLQESILRITQLPIAHMAVAVKKGNKMNNKNQSAFPGQVQYDSNGMALLFYTGLTKREYFAAAALQGMLAFPGDPVGTDLVIDAIRYADEILLKLEENKNEP